MTTPSSTTTIGLTGGVGSGKSTVAKLFAQHGALVIDADAVAREVVKPGAPALAEIAEAFGQAVITSNGELDRPALAAIVFADPVARAQLNAITHPRIGARTAEIMASAHAGQVIVHDVPLLVENGLAPAYDMVIVVEADEDVRLARLQARGMSEDDARRRMAAQATDAERRANADVLLANNSDLTSLSAQVDAVWQQITLRR